MKKLIILLLLSITCLSCELLGEEEDSGFTCTGDLQVISRVTELNTTGPNIYNCYDIKDVFKFNNRIAGQLSESSVVIELEGVQSFMTIWIDVREKEFFEATPSEVNAVRWRVYDANKIPLPADFYPNEAVVSSINASDNTVSITINNPYYALSNTRRVNFEPISFKDLKVRI